MPQNLMRDRGSGAVRIIDLEYGGLNYPAFDIANHFMEWCGGTTDAVATLGVPEYHRLPTTAQQVRSLLFPRSERSVAHVPCYNPAGHVPCYNPALL